MESSASAFVAQPVTTAIASTSATGAVTVVTLRSILDKCGQNVSVRTSGVLSSASVRPTSAHDIAAAADREQLSETVAHPRSATDYGAPFCGPAGP